MSAQLTMLIVQLAFVDGLNWRQIMRDPIEHAVTNVALIMALLSAEDDEDYDDDIEYLEDDGE